MTATDIQVVSAEDGQPVTTLIPGEKVEIRVAVAPGKDLPSSFEVTVASDRDTKTITVKRMVGSGDANPTYTSVPTDVGRGPVADGYAGRSGPLDSLDIGNGSGVTISAAGGSTDVTWYKDELSAQVGTLDWQLFTFDTYLTYAEIGLKDAPDTSGVRAARELVKRKREIISYLRKQIANPNNWPRGLLNALRVGLTALNARSAAELETRTVIHDIGNALTEGKEEGKGILLSGFAELTLGFYEQLVGATGAGDVWTLVFGQDIFGKDVDAKGRLDAAANIAFTAAMTLVPILHLGRYRVGRTTRRISRPKPARPPAGVKPTKAPPGTHVHPNEFGMLPEGARHVNRVAEANGVVITVRPTNKEAMKWRAEGCPGKPEALKPKTVNDLDTHLGAKKENIGLVAYFEPQRPIRPPEMSDTQWAAVEKRFGDRRQEFHDNSGKIEHLIHEGQIEVRDGIIYDTGICGGTGKPITGDYDLWDVTLPNGTPVRGADLELIVNQLRFGGYGAQHGPHKAWVIDPTNPAYVADPNLLKGHRKVDADIRVKHAFDASDPEAVIEFKGYSSAPVTRFEGAPTPTHAPEPWRPDRIGDAPAVAGPMIPFLLPRPWTFFSPPGEGQPVRGSAAGGSIGLVTLPPIGVPSSPTPLTVEQRQSSATAGTPRALDALWPDVQSAFDKLGVASPDLGDYALSASAMTDEELAAEVAAVDAHWSGLRFNVHSRAGDQDTGFWTSFAAWLATSPTEGSFGEWGAASDAAQMFREHGGPELLAKHRILTDISKRRASGDWQSSQPAPLLDSTHYDDGHALGWGKKDAIDQLSGSGHYEDGQAFGWQKMGAPLPSDSRASTAPSPSATERRLPIARIGIGGAVVAFLIFAGFAFANSNKPSQSAAPGVAAIAAPASAGPPVNCDPAPDLALSVTGAANVKATKGCLPTRKPGAATNPSTPYCRLQGIPNPPGTVAGVLSVAIAFVADGKRYEVMMGYVADQRVSPNKGKLPATLTVGDGQEQIRMFTSDAKTPLASNTTQWNATSGTHTFAADGAGGMIDVDFVSNGGQTMHVSGGFTVAGGCPKTG
ncbi:MAG: hypothetical protein NVS9B11_18720 [Candidatus Dormibacteraceae bacterium]